MRRKERASQIPIWNRLVTLTINDREKMYGGGEGTSSKEENGGREWLSAAAMSVGIVVSVGCWLCFMTCAVKNKEQVGIQGVSACTFGTRMYGDLWEHVAFKKIKNEKMVTMTSQF